MSAQRKWPLVLLGAAAVLLVPWTVVLALTLPGSTQVDHWPLAWAIQDSWRRAG